MKKELFFSLSMLLAAAIVPGCQTDNEMSGPAILEVNSTKVTVNADNALESDPFSESVLPVTDTVWISSSRSWTAITETADGGDWVRINTSERINVTGQKELYPLVVSFDRYRGSQPRMATLTLYGVDIEQPVEVEYTQQAYTPSLEVSAKDDNPVVTSKDGECYVLIKSNTSWSISVDEASSTVIPVLSATSGFDSKAILVSFPENTDDEKARIASLVFKAGGVPDKRLELIQSQSDRFFMLAGEVSSNLEPYEKEVFIPLRSNGPWTAEISDCTFENAQLVPSAGKQALDGFIFQADHGADPEVAEKHATITIRREAMNPIVVSFSQKGSIHLSFMSRNPEYEWNGRDYFDIDSPYRPYQPNGQVFSSPASFPYNYSNGSYKGVELECETFVGGYVFTMFGQDCGVWLGTGDFGLCVGKRKGDYVRFPALEGFRLATMYYEASCMVATPYTVRDDYGEVIKGGEPAGTLQVIPLTCEHHDMHVHQFPETVAGEHYKLTLEEDLRFISIKELCLVYE